jgi:hypothetical protein
MGIHVCTKNLGLSVNGSLANCAGCLATAGENAGDSDSVTWLFTLPVQSLQTLPTFGDIGIDVNISTDLIVCAFTENGALGTAASQIIFDARPTSCTLGQLCQIYLQGAQQGHSYLKFVHKPDADESSVTATEVNNDCQTLNEETWDETALRAQAQGWNAYNCDRLGCTFGTDWTPRSISGVFGLCTMNSDVVSGTSAQSKVIVGLFSMIGPDTIQSKLAERGQPLTIDIQGLWDQPLHKSRVMIAQVSSCQTTPVCTVLAPKRALRAGGF